MFSGGLFRVRVGEGRGWGCLGVSVHGGIYHEGIEFHEGGTGFSSII